MISLPVISDKPAIQAFYLEMRRDGQSHNIAEICALRQGPGVETENSYLNGVGDLRSQFEDESELNRVVKAAKKQGYTPKATDTYEPGIANSCGDPAAFVPHIGPKSHVKRVCEKRDVTCHGGVEVKRKAKG